MIERLTMTLKAIPGRTCSVGEMFKLFCKIFELTSLKEFMAAAEACAEPDGVLNAPWFCGCDCWAATPKNDTSSADDQVLQKWLFT